jgi:hypothetical protein
MGAGAKRKVGRPRRVVDDDDDEGDLPPPPGASFESPMPWETDRFAKEVHEILDSVEAPPVDARVLITLQKHLYRSGIFGTDGRGHIILLIKTILESENNGDALIEPIVSAVSCCMRPEWTGRGLQWIEAFDQIPLVDILTKLRDLDLFPEKELEHHYAVGIQRRLWRFFGPDVVPESVKVKRRPKTTRPSGISEQSWADVLALRKKPKPASGRRRPVRRMAA